jgi:hypothetical protein
MPRAFSPREPGENVLILPEPVTLKTALQSGELRGRTVAHVDTLHQRLPAAARQRMQELVAQAGKSSATLQGAFVAAMLASESTRQMAQLSRIGPALGLEVTHAAREFRPALDELNAAARLPVLVALLPSLVEIDAGRQARIRAVANAFAPHVAAGDWFRYAVTRILEPSIVRAHPQAKALPANAPLIERNVAAATLVLAMTQCRYGTGAGESAYRRALVAVLPPAKWPPIASEPVDAAALDAALATLLDLSDSATKIVIEGLVALIAEMRVINAAQADLLRAACILLDVPMPFLPVEFRFDR